MRKLFGFMVVALALLALPAAAQPSAGATGPIDGLRVVFCGTSGPLPIVGRAKPCVHYNRYRSLFDYDPDLVPSLNATI